MSIQKWPAYTARWSSILPLFSLSLVGPKKTVPNHTSGDVTPAKERAVATDRSAERGASQRMLAGKEDMNRRLGPGSAVRLKSRLVRDDSGANMLEYRGEALREELP